MKKIYINLILLNVFIISQNHGFTQVNYVFKSFQSAYTPLTNGVNPALDNPTPIGYYEDDEGFANQVEIGFNFNFNQLNYTKLNINVNGFVTFGEGFLQDVGEKYHTNNLMSGPSQANTRPLIAPLWDDLRLNNNQSLKYLTTGTTPNRIFTVEWSNVQWSLNTLNNVISFQMKLYETSNLIQFHYQPLDGNIADASASIGIATCSSCTGSFLSVNNFLDAAISGVQEFKNINVKPLTSMSFEFAPAKTALPETLIIDKYTSRKVSFSWNSSSSNQFDYAVTTSTLQPSNFNTTNNKNIEVDNLRAGTKYYIHLRSVSNQNEKSGWLSIPFKAPSEVTLPYKEKFENTTIPENLGIANPTGGNAWQVVALNNTPPYNNAISYNGNNAQQANAWFMLPGISLEGGRSYRLKFKYKVSDTLMGNQKVEVRIGTEFNNNIASWVPIYKNVKLNELRFKDTSLLFATPVNEVYFLAFRCISDKGVASLLLDDIEITTVLPSPVKLITFSGIKVGNKNVLNWKTSAEIKNKQFELQKGADGINFSTISTIPTKAINGNSNTTLDYITNDSIPFLSTYYRLKITDIDKNEFFSQAINVKGILPMWLTYSKVFPNPVKDIITAVINSPYNAKGYFRIMDMHGKILLNTPVSIFKGDNIFTADVSRFGKGTYMSKVVSIIGAASEARSFIKQ